MFFDNWSDLLHILAMGLLAYPLFVVSLRVCGKRTLSTMNAFDLVVTVALGAILARTILAQNVTLVEGFAGFAVLIGLQIGVTWLSVRSATIRHLVRAEPILLFHRGQYLQQAMRRERITEDDILAAIRAQGMATVETVEAVIIEGNGRLVALPTPQQGGASALSNLKTPDEDDAKSAT